MYQMAAAVCLGRIQNLLSQAPRGRPLPEGGDFRGDPPGYFPNESAALSAQVPMYRDISTPRSVAERADRNGEVSQVAEGMAEMRDLLHAFSLRLQSLEERSQGSGHSGGAYSLGWVGNPEQALGWVDMQALDDHYRRLSLGPSESQAQPHAEPQVEASVWTCSFGRTLSGWGEPFSFSCIVVVRYGLQ